MVEQIQHQTQLYNVQHEGIYFKHDVDVRGREDLWELGGDRDFGLGNECIFNGRESKDLEVRLRVSGCIINVKTDTETLKACAAHRRKDMDSLTHPPHLSTCQHVCPC